MENMLFLLFYMICLSACAVLALAGYILYGVGLCGMAREAGISYAWIAFVPFARKYLQGKLGGPITLKGKTLKEPGLWLLLVPFAVGVVSGFLAGFLMILVLVGAMVDGNAVIIIPVTGVAVLVGILIFLLILVGTAVKNGLRALVNYQILSRYCKGNLLILHMVFSILLPLYESVVFFYYRHKPFICNLHNE